MSSRVTKATALARVQALIAGTQKHLPSATMTLGNASVSSASLIKLLQSLVDAMKAVDVAQASAKDTLQALASTHLTVDPTIRAFEQFVRAAFGSVAQTLEDFGLVPPKARRPLTSEQKAARAQKALATRKLRGTKGSRQKALIKAPSETTVSQTTTSKA